MRNFQKHVEDTNHSFFCIASNVIVNHINISTNVIHLRYKCKNIPHHFNHTKNLFMKRAKKFPFLSLQKERLQFFLEISTVETTPAEGLFRQWIWHALKDYYPRAEINLLIADEEEAKAYNEQYRGKNTATNVLSFALNEGEEFLPNDNILRGDLVLCPQIIAKEALEQNKSLTAHYAHLTIHGVLHLIGFDHIDENDAVEMETLEIKLLHQLGYNNPYLEN